jgi:radical SAM superfamily enzyme YgiQ (UPF0313 family)
MIIQGYWQRKTIFFSVKPNCLTIGVERQNQADVYSFDYAGRSWTAMLENVSYRRGLDGKTVAKWILPNGERARRWLAPHEADVFAENARKSAAIIVDAIKNGEIDLQGVLPQSGMKGLINAAAFDSERRQAETERYRQIYLPVGILPPDQYGAVVLQATEGCSFNACTFCSFYKDRPFKIKNADEFGQHCLNVRDFLGEGLSLRRTIFLGDANALVAPMSRLQQLFEVTHRFFDVEALGGIYAFLDGVSGEKKTHEDYALLANLGLQRVYIGLESGSQDLLSYLNKPCSPEEVVRAVRAMKKGGVDVGVIILLGAGGKKYAKRHIRETIKAINRMDLDLNDIVYFSEMVQSEGMDYLRQAYEDHLSPLTASERISQGEQIEKGLKFSREGGTPHISRYDIREFVY